MEEPPGSQEPKVPATLKEPVKEQSKEQPKAEEKMHVVQSKYGAALKTSGDIGKDFKDARKVQKVSQTTQIRSLYKIVLQSRGGQAQQRWWMTCLVGLVGLRTWVLSRDAATHGMITRAIHTGDQAVLRAGLLRSFFVVFAKIAVEQTTALVKGRLALVWQTKMTQLLHEKYFCNHNYYALIQSKEHNISDPDQRIAGDVKDVMANMADLLCQGGAAIGAGAYCSWRVYKEMGFVWSVAPYVYVWFGIWWTDKAFPLDWRRIVGLHEFVLGDLRQGHSRLVMNAEAIAALNGNKVEHELLSKKLAATEDVQRRFWTALCKYTFVNTLAFTHLASVFTPVAVMAPLLSRPQSAELGDDAQVVATVGYRMALFSEAMRATSMLVMAWKALLQLGGNSARVTKLLEVLDHLQEQRRGRLNASFVEGDDIEFKDVDIVTPTGELLVKNLSFKVEHGSSLMVTGHNGAGKSSIFRCLGGLWAFPRGTIVKPGAATEGLHREVFYLPQKPYNVLGTLVDQLTYPNCGGAQDGSLERERLQELLQKVDLGYLLDREGVLEDEVNWEEALSLGEKQRLAMARMVHHKPKFAILDECTSGVSLDMEQRFFSICREMGITCITISHRPALRAFHDRILSIGDGSQGFKLQNVNAPAVPIFMGTASSSPAAPPPRAPLPRASAPARRQPTATESFRQLAALVRLALPKDWRRKVVVALVTAGARAWVGSSFGFIIGNFYTRLLLRDSRGFAKYTALAVLWACAYDALDRSVDLCQRHLGTDMRMRLSEQMLKMYFDTAAYYRLKHVDKTIEDPEARLTADIRIFALHASDLLADLPKLIADGLLQSAILGRLIGMKAVVLLSAYSLAGISTLKFIMPDYRQMVQQEMELDGKYRFEHTRVRQCSESIAFFGGDQRERAIVDKRYEQGASLRRHVLWQTWRFKLLQDFLLKGLPETLGFSAQAVGGSANANLSEQQQTRLGVERAFSVLEELFSYYGVVGAKLSGSTGRIHELLEELHRLRVETTDAGSVGLATGSRSIAPTKISDDICFDGVDLVTPSGQPLATGLEFRVERGQPLMVTGPNACGKTSLFRVLGGLWPAFASASAPSPCLSRPRGSGGSSGLADVFLVPQRVYMADGSLGDQVTYPERHLAAGRTPELEAKMLRQMELVGLRYLVGREGGWDATSKWEDVLSLGEQQRLGVARLLFHRPAFAVLDECTSAVSVDAEEKIYEVAHSTGITCITLSQRLALTQFHSRELKLGLASDSGWSLTAIEPA